MGRARKLLEAIVAGTIVLFARAAAAGQLIAALDDGPPGHQTQIERFSDSGSPLGEFLQSRHVGDLATSPRGIIYAVLYPAVFSGEYSVERFGSLGNAIGPLAVPADGSLGIPLSVAANSAGDAFVVYAKNAGGTSVRQFNSEGEFVSTFKDFPNGDGNNIAFDPAGNVVIATRTSINQYDAQGRLLGEIGIPFFGQNIFDMAFTNDGGLFAVSSLFVPGDGFEIYRSAGFGQPLTRFVANTGPVSGFSVAVDGHDNVYVGGGPDDYTATGFVNRFTPNGTFLGQFLSNLNGPPGRLAFFTPEPGPPSLAGFALLGFAAIRSRQQYRRPLHDTRLSQ